LTRILFVCLGNICRSPLAEGVFRHLADEAGVGDRFEVDSVGTGPWHVGEAPDRRMRETARRRGVPIDDLRGRQISAADFDRFDLVLAMDREVLGSLRRFTADGANPTARLFRDFDPDRGDGEVPDPYYGGPAGFEEVYDIVERTSRGLLSHLTKDGGVDAGRQL
jgi:protein-tyrosine phosphatase